MNITTSIHVDAQDNPDVAITTDGIPLAHLGLSRGVFRAVVAATDPAYLRRLARAADEAAARLSAALDVEAARQVNAQAGLPIVCQAGIVHLDWSSANACTAGHTIGAAAGAA